MITQELTQWGRPLQQAIRDDLVPQGTEVLIGVKFCGICHSDVHIREGFFDLGGGKQFKMAERGMKLPTVLGHEPYGKVLSAGPLASEAPIGEDRLVYPWTGCAQCSACEAEQDNWCPQPRYIGIQRPGSYATQLLVPHPKYLIDVSGIEPSFAPILACSGLTTYSAIQKLLPMSNKDWVVVMGAGGLGLMAISILKAMGHDRIAVCEIDESKWPSGLQMGAKHTFNPQDERCLQALKSLSHGVYGVLDFVGAPNTAQLGLGALRKGGRYVIVGLFGGEISIPLVTLAQRAISIIGSYVGSLSELHAVVDLAKSGQLKPIPTQLCAMEEISEVLDQLLAAKVRGRVVAQFPQLPQT
jgi:D-arabinose 1-dehydrogenase-like Zn-dependent alcohol dehydrogenase